MTEIKTEGELKAFLLEHPKTVLQCWALWCGHCHEMLQTLVTLEPQANALGIAIANVEEKTGLTIFAKIEAYPHVVLFRDGKPVARVEGVHDRLTTYKWILKHLGV